MRSSPNALSSPAVIIWNLPAARQSRDLVTGHQVAGLGSSKVDQDMAAYPLPVPAAVALKYGIVIPFNVLTYSLRRDLK